MAIQLPRYRFCVDDYHRMAEAGILSEDASVELIEGEIVQMSPIGGPHIACVTRLNRTLSLAVGDDVFVSVQNPVRLDPDTEPQPDLALFMQLPDGPAPPSAADVLLVIEVADSSLRYDREVKIPLYSRASIPEVWLVDLNDRTVYRSIEPRNGTYRVVELYQPGDDLSPASLPFVALSVASLFE